jgi:hypothetical protein
MEENVDEMSELRGKELGISSHHEIPINRL